MPSLSNFLDVSYGSFFPKSYGVTSQLPDWSVVGRDYRPSPLFLMLVVGASSIQRIGEEVDRRCCPAAGRNVL